MHKTTLRQIPSILWASVLPVFILGLMFIMCWAITHEDPVKAWADGYEQGVADARKEQAR